MKMQFVRAFGDIQELFQQLMSEGKITPEQAERFNQAQKTVVNYHTWVENQLSPVLKVQLPWTNEAFIKAWELWKKYKKERNFTYKPIGEQSALAKLNTISDGDMHTAIAILKQSRENGWSGIFPLKEEQTKKEVLPNMDHKKDIFNRLTKQK